MDEHIEQAYQRALHGREHGNLIERGNMNSARICLVVVAAAVAGASLPTATKTFAQEPSRPMFSQTEWNALTDERISLVKAALQLTPEQEKYWPAIEKAIRARAESRENRITEMRERLSDRLKSDSKADPIAFMHRRAEALIQRGNNLKNLADAWQPLAQTLNPDQKKRMRLLVADALRDIRDAVEDRRMETIGMGR